MSKRIDIWPWFRRYFDDVFEEDFDEARETKSGELEYTDEDIQSAYFAGWNDCLELTAILNGVNPHSDEYAYERAVEYIKIGAFDLGDLIIEAYDFDVDDVYEDAGCDRRGG